MHNRRILLFVLLLLPVLLIAPATVTLGMPTPDHSAGHSSQAASTMPGSMNGMQSVSDPRADCVAMGMDRSSVAVPESQWSHYSPSPGHLIHPCSGVVPMFAEPPFTGCSPLSITLASTFCTSNVFAAAYGDIAVWQAGGHSYVAVAGFAQRNFYIWNVDNAYSPQLLATSNFPTGTAASLSVFAWKQGTNRYISTALRGSGTGCGLFVYNVNDPANPQFVARKTGADWCTVHEHFVSTNANGDGDYAWLTMSGETGSGIKIVAVDVSQLPTITETGRYQRPDSVGFAHDSNVVGDRVFVADWDGGVQIFDKNTLAHNINPTPLNPIDSIRPSFFRVHHVVPTSDGNHVFIEDEMNNTPSLAKIKVYNISNISAPYYETQIVGVNTVEQNNRAHNMRIKPVSPGHDLLLVGWYEGGTKGFDIDTTGPAPVITEVLSHQLRQTTDGAYGNVWGVDYLPCTVRGAQTTCVYSADMAYGLVVDALGYNPDLDPYAPESVITDPVNGQNITTCTYTISGNAHDYYSGLSLVEVSTDGGGTWNVAQGTTSWTYQWTIPASGSYNILVRATDNAGNVQTPGTPVTVNVTAPCSGATATPTNAPTATPTACNVQFTDVTVGSTFYPYVRCLACRGIVSGYPCGGPGEPCDANNNPYFRPNAWVTRGQIAKIVSNAAGINTPPGAQIFEDVPSGNAFYAYINRLYNLGVMGGYTCGGTNPETGEAEPCVQPNNRPYFRPSNTATRGQLSKIVSNTAGYSDTPTTQTFEDVGTTHPFYVWIERLTSRGIMGGYPCGGVNSETGQSEPCGTQNRPYFRPYNHVTRGQTAKIVANTFFPSCQTP